MIAFCPSCHPTEAPDPLTEFSERCSQHPGQVLAGLDDGAVSFSLEIASEAAVNRAVCAAVHRGRAETE